MQLKDIPEIKGLVDRTQKEVSRQPLFSKLKKDIPAGVVVFLVALPLCLGIALASGAPLISGLISGIIGGLVVGYISQSSTSVTGPAASVSAVVLVAIQDLGSFEIFLVALVLAGILQLGLGLLRAGIIADYMPTSIIKGLLAAIGLILILSQIPYALGLDFNKDRFSAYTDNIVSNIGDILAEFLQSFSAGALIITGISLFILTFWDKTPLKKIKLLPPALIVVVLGVVINFIFKLFLPQLYLSGVHLVQIPSIGGVSELITFPNFSGIFNTQVWTAAVTIAVVASISTLLNIEATDNIDPHKRWTPPNRELVAQGIGNTLAGLFGGIALTSVIVRSSVNIEAGSETKMSTITHGALLLMSVFLLSPVLNMIPLATLASILLVVGYKLASVEVFKELYHKGWNQFLPFVVTIVGIMMTDVLIGVLIGSCLSVFFLLRSNYHNPFFIENTSLVQEEVIKLELSNEVSFLNKASIKNTLWKIPENSKVIIDATFSNYIDQDVLDMLKDFKGTVAREHNIDVTIIGLKENYDIGEELDFLEREMEAVKQKSTPEQVLNYLKEGNKKYTSGDIVSRRYRNKELKDFLTASPLAVVVSCVDLREPLNMVFNSGISDLIPMRAAANLVGSDLLSSIEISCLNQKAKLIVVLGNSDNRIIQEALNNNLNNASSHDYLLIESALKQKGIELHSLRGDDLKRITDTVTEFNVQLSAEFILNNSQLIRTEVESGNVGIVWAIFNRDTGSVHFSELLVSKPSRIK
jgi:carbonic anhydrase